MNDPMEGVYLAPLDESKISKMFEEKDGFVICSFSSEEALDNPLSWGHYANGFKGIAIGIEVNKPFVFCLPGFSTGTK